MCFVFVEVMGAKDEPDMTCFVFSFFFLLNIILLSFLFVLEQSHWVILDLPVKELERGEEKSNETIYHLLHFYGNGLNLASRVHGCLRRSIT